MGWSGSSRAFQTWQGTGDLPAQSWWDRSTQQCRPLHLDQITAVAIPSVDQEAVRNLVRAREDCRGDLVQAGTGPEAVVAPRDRLLRGPRLDAHYENVLAVKTRRDRLDDAFGEMAAASEFTPLVHRLGCRLGSAP